MREVAALGVHLTKGVPHEAIESFDAVKLTGVEFNGAVEKGKINLCVGEGGPGRSDEATDIFGDGDGGLLPEAIVDAHREQNQVD